MSDLPPPRGPVPWLADPLKPGLPGTPDAAMPDFRRILGGLAVGGAGRAAVQPVTSASPLLATSSLGSFLPDFAKIAAGLSAPTNPLSPASVAAAIVPASAPAAAPPSPLAMLSILAAGTHKFVPVSYDPFAVEEAGVGSGAASGMTTAPAIGGQVKKIGSPADAPRYALMTLGGKKAGPGNLGMDPAVQNLFAGIGPAT